jgi:hypothetical protein
MDAVASGRKWARTWLVIALVVSVVGNVAHTVLADSSISLGLRVPGAVVWPAFVFGAIEVLIRVVWQPKATHRFARTMLLLPIVPAAITSYEHLFRLLQLMGETDFIAAIGPAAIDGLMIGCTLTVLFTRPEGTTLEPVRTGPVYQYDKPIGPMPMVDPIWQEFDLASITQPIEPDPRPVSPAPARSRISRGDVPEALLAAIKALELDETPEYGPGASKPVVDRYRRVIRALRTDPHADIPAAEWKVRSELVEKIRVDLRSAYL